MRRACRALRAWPITGSGSCRVDDRDIDIGQGDALPSIETTMRFLALCDLVRLARGRGVPGLLDRGEWSGWTAAQMRAAVEYLQEAGAAVTESGVARRQQRGPSGR